MFLDERIDNVPAGHTSPSFHPHRNTALLHVDQVIDNNETVTSCALHGALLCSRWSPRPRRRIHFPFPSNRMLKKSASGVLASLRGSTYRSVRLRLFARCGLAGGLFEHPAWCTRVSQTYRTMKFWRAHRVFPQPSKLTRRVTNRLPASEYSNRDATGVVATPCVF